MKEQERNEKALEQQQEQEPEQAQRTAELSEEELDSIAGGDAYAHPRFGPWQMA